MRTSTICRTVSVTLVCLAVAAGMADAQLVPEAARPDGFHVALLLGSNASGASPTGLPAAAQKALGEASEVLSFKRFELLDQAVLRGEAGGKTTSLKGPRGRLYRLEVSSTPSAPPSRSIAKGTFVEIPTEATVAVTLADATGSSEQALLHTTVTARLGETAVLGTSTPVTGPGDQALLLLLTPIPAGGAARLLAPAVEYARAAPDVSQAPGFGKAADAGLPAAPTAQQATDFLRTVLTSECGTGMLFHDWPLPQDRSVVMKTQGVAVSDGVLRFERVPVSNILEQHPAYHSTQGSARVYRVRLQELRPDPFGPPQPTFERQADGLTFQCARQGCVNVDGNRVSTLVIPVCAEKRGDVLRAFQRLIADVGGSARDSLPGPVGRATLVSSLHVALLRASNTPGPAPAGLAPEVATGLQEAAKVGPYKRFELLDQAVVRGSGAGWASLRGPDSRRFGLVTKSEPGESVYDVAVSLHLFETKGRELSAESPEVMATEYTARAGQSTIVWAADTPPAAERPTLVLLLTPVTAANAETFLGPAAAQAMTFLTSELFGTCGTEATFSGVGPDSVMWTTLWRTARVTLRDWVLAIERFTARSAGSPGGARRTYRAKLDLLNPDADVPVGPPANQPGGVIFRCKSPNCVLVEGAGEPLLQIPMCAEKRDELIAAMQMLIVAAGGGWESAPAPRPTPSTVK